MYKRSMIDVALSILSQKPLAFNELYKEVCKELEFSKKDEHDKIAMFYTQLTLDGRFILKNNLWDLREHAKFDDKKYMFEVENQLNEDFGEVDDEDEFFSDFEDTATNDIDNEF